MDILLELFILLVFGPGMGFSRNTDRLSDSAALARKTIAAVRTSEAMKIDGAGNEAIWNTAPVATEFVEYGPRNGTRPPFGSEVRFAYDDEALYILAILHDPHPDSICRELGRRDQVESLNTDYISFDLLPYNDGLNMYEFKVSPANLQNDCKYSAVGVDLSWDAVWESAAQINADGWVAEVRIPWSALRFPKVTEQVWGINMWRNIQRFHEFSTWSWVDNKTQEIFKYYGTLTGMHDIRPPLRLSFSPYLAGYVEKNPDNRKWDWSLRGGLDLRYGLNESYTLDMMLVPDFGQVPSDDQVLNLTPFSIRYDEKRQFFTEGTELFNKCDIFYTRRVGSTPRNYNKPYEVADSNETVSDNPDLTRIINATKISGRNAKGLGIGLFNGMTTNTWATLRDAETGESRRVMTQPFTNYNVLVFDQNLKNNSYVTLINTNYWTPADGYCANVTGAETTLKNRKATLQLFGRLNVSQKYTDGISPAFGHQYTIAVSKPSGRFQYQVLRQETNDTYDPNDMGFLPYNNETYNRLRLSWYEMDPKGKVLNHQTDLQASYITLYHPDRFKTLEFALNNSITFVHYWINALYAGIQPLGYDDYYEPRVPGYVYKMPLNYSGEWRLASNNTKRFRYHHNVGFMNSPGNDNFRYYFGVTPRFRFSDRLSATLDVQVQEDLNNYGWAETQSDSSGVPVSIFGRRDVLTVANVLAVRYIFSTKAALSVRARHYWSQARYLSFYTLNADGSLTPAAFEPGHDINFNAFTVDMQFTWYFAPGSELSVVWKNAITTSGEQLENRYFADLGNTLSSPQSNSISARVLYYIDYQTIGKLFSKKRPAATG